MIDINTFILYGEHFRNRSLQLEVLIADYIEFTKGQLNQLIAKTSEERAKDSMDSFTTFISVHKKIHWKIPALFNELGLDLFKA